LSYNRKKQRKEGEEMRKETLQRFWESVSHVLGIVWEVIWAILLFPYILFNGIWKLLNPVSVTFRFSKPVSDKTITEIVDELVMDKNRRFREKTKSLHIVGELEELNTSCCIWGAGNRIVRWSIRDSLQDRGVATTYKLNHAPGLFT
jgi:hypothetical protein